MTVHSAKGLEFHTVFITGLEEGLFPHQNSQREDGGLDEERRLMYVALTRARRRLYLSFAQSRMLHGQVSYGMASSFLRELPDDLLHWLTPRVTQRNAFASSKPTSLSPSVSVGGRLLPDKGRWEGFAWHIGSACSTRSSARAPSPA